MSLGARARYILLALGLGSCTSSLVAMRFDRPGDQQVSAVLDATRDVTFWTDLDVTYGGQVEARFNVELVQDGAVVARTTCDPLRPTGPVTVCTKNVQIGEHHHVTCRMQCGLRVPKTGLTLVRASLVLDDAPPDLRLDRADISVEQ